MSEEQKVARKETVYEEVLMDNGQTVKFPGNRKLLKRSEVSEDGFTVNTSFYFRNGEVRIFTIEANAALFAQFVAHGVEQKIGDEVAGLQEIDDMIIAIDDVMDRLNGGEWTAKRESSGMTGISVLAKALVKASGKSAAEVVSFLKQKNNAEKLALRKSPKIASFIEEIEANKKKKPKAEIDTEAHLAELGV